MRLRHATRTARYAQVSVHYRSLSTAPPNDARSGEQANEGQKEPGAMSRRLAALSEQGLEEGGRSARKAVEEAGFDEDLKRALQERIASAGFRNENAGAFAQAELPASAGRQTRDLAGAAPWSGTESVHDASLRMLNDSYKPMKVSPRPGPIRGPPRKVDTGRPKSAPTAGARLANARDKTSVYNYMKDLPDDEREKLRQEMKERFTPGARSLPMSIKGLESLANERIEDAIARGQFRNLPRGKVIERDYNASSPFINTTEYLLNRMIQRQDIVPPWIEKQQEILSTVNRFRGRLRADWKRHVARSIASGGGSLESQMLLAEGYARAEAVENPRPKRKTETINSVDEAGHLSRITLAGELKPTGDSASISPPEKITVTERPIDDSGETLGAEKQVKISVEHVHTEVSTPASPATEQSIALGAEEQVKTPVEHAHTEILTPPSPATEPGIAPFRDHVWLQTETSYLRAAIENLNSLTRSYNLMCPKLAQRPYYSLDREMKACYAEVAPEVAGAIRDRALAPRAKTEPILSKPVRVLGNLAGPQARVYDEQKPQFGFRDLWREWFGKTK